MHARALVRPQVIWDGYLSFPIGLEALLSNLSMPLARRAYEGLVQSKALRLGALGVDARQRHPAQRQRR
jgi:hypothetical protein